jgi:VIT1/CCC1 family predicted Fe2+/Mn2+ transporter
VPYIALGDPGRALVVSVVITLLALVVFGFVKGRFTGSAPLKSALQTMLIGGIAAAAAFGLARAVA